MAWREAIGQRKDSGRGRAEPKTALNQETRTQLPASGVLHQRITPQGVSNLFLICRPWNPRAPPAA